jgi:type I restriction enzyme S subunit
MGAEAGLLTGFPFQSSGFTKDGIRLLRGSNVKRGVIDWSEDITQYWPAIDAEVREFELRKDDLVVAMDGALVGRSFASVDAADLPALLVQRVARLRSTGVQQGLLRAWIASEQFVRYVDAVKTHTAIPHISPRDIREFRIVVPVDIGEQRAIAEALSDVDDLIASLERLIAKKRDIKTATMGQLLTGRTRLPGFTGEWERKRLGEVAEVVMGQSPPSASYNHAGRGIPLLQGNADVADRKAVARVYTEAVTKWGQAGDVLLSVRAPVGAVARTNFACCLGRGMCALRRADEFVFHALMHAEPEWSRISKGSTFDAVTGSDVREFTILVPPSLSERESVAAVLSDMDAEIEALEARLDKTRMLKQGMMQELLTGRTRLV